MGALLLKYGLIAVFIGGALEGDVTFVVAGVTTHLGLLHLPSAIVAGTLGALTGDCTLYWLGRSRSTQIRNTKAYQRAEPIASRLADRLGPWEILVARFVYGARIASIIFWSTRRLSFVKFVAVDLIGCFIWCCLLMTLGRLLTNRATILIGEVRRVELLLLAVVIVIVTTSFVVKTIFRRRVLKVNE